MFFIRFIFSLILFLFNRSNIYLSLLLLLFNPLINFLYSNIKSNNYYISSNDILIYSIGQIIYIYETIFIISENKLNIVYNKYQTNIIISSIVDFFYYIYRTLYNINETIKNYISKKIICLIKFITFYCIKCIKNNPDKLQQIINSLSSKNKFNAHLIASIIPDPYLLDESINNGKINKAYEEDLNKIKINTQNFVINSEEDLNKNEANIQESVINSEEDQKQAKKLNNTDPLYNFPVDMFFTNNNLTQELPSNLSNLSNLFNNVSKINSDKINSDKINSDKINSDKIFKILQLNINFINYIKKNILNILPIPNNELENEILKIESKINLFLIKYNTNIINTNTTNTKHTKNNLELNELLNLIKKQNSDNIIDEYQIIDTIILD
jgi:hypothetical protein